MAVSATFPDDVIVGGWLVGMAGIGYPLASIENRHVSPAAAVEARKLQRSLAPSTFQTGTAQDETRMLRIVKGLTGTLKHFTVSNVVACGGTSTVTVDLQVNGVSVLAAVVTLNPATGNRGEEVGVIATAAVADGDVLEAVINATQVGTCALATGVFAQVDMDEAYAA